MRIENGFQQAPPPEDNPYISDSVLPSLLKRTLPTSVLQEIEPDLVRFGADINTKIRDIGSRVNPPTLTQYDQWGRRVDELKTSEGWRELKALCQKEGIPGISYERKYKEHSRTYGLAKAFLMMGDAHMIFCPLSMTDGAARVIELFGSSEMKTKILPRLISRDPALALTSGQWMTERPGGSDVSQTETSAISQERNHPFGPQYNLDGFKWFSSATDSDVALALARTGRLEDGSRGLSLFLVPLRLPLLPAPSDPTPSPTSNKIFIHRLKNKIGTHSLPTAELSLECSEAYLVGDVNKGVKTITPVLSITRIWSAMGSVGALRRCLSIATSYAKVRTINGSTTLLRDAPLHVSQLAPIHILYRALAHLTFGVIRLVGKAECGVVSANELRRLRLLTPTLKAFAAEKACAGMEEAMSALGGAGYMEENGIGRLIRDSLVEKIWEGTTTVLALDLIRAVQDPATLDAFIMWASEIFSYFPPELRSRLEEPLDVLNKAISELAGSLRRRPIVSLVPRPALILTGFVASSAFLFEHAIWAHPREEANRDTEIDVLRRWVLESGLQDAINEVRIAMEHSDSRSQANTVLVFGKDLFKAKM